MTQIERVKLLECDLEKCVLSGILARDTGFALHIRGQWNAEMAERMIAYLRQVQSWLAEDEAAREEQKAHAESLTGGTGCLTGAEVF